MTDKGWYGIKKNNQPINHLVVWLKSSKVLSVFKTSENSYDNMLDKLKINTETENCFHLLVIIWSFSPRIYIYIYIWDGEYTNNILRRNKFIMTA